MKATLFVVCSELRFAIPTFNFLTCDLNANRHIMSHVNSYSCSDISPQVQEGIELAAYESIPGNQRINLAEILGDQVPPEVISNLQGQIDQVGRN